MHNVTSTLGIFSQLFAFKVMHRVLLLTRFCKLLTTVAILSGRGAPASSASMAAACLEAPLDMDRLVNVSTGNRWSFVA